LPNYVDAFDIYSSGAGIGAARRRGFMVKMSLYPQKSGHVGDNLPSSEAARQDLFLPPPPPSREDPHEMQKPRGVAAGYASSP
jgi:hypothetical protein